MCFRGDYYVLFGTNTIDGSDGTPESRDLIEIIPVCHVELVELLPDDLPLQNILPNYVYTYKYNEC